MVEVDRLDAETLHLALVLLDQASALDPERLEFFGREGPFEDEEAVLAKAAPVLAGEGCCPRCP
jgi:hypothetical protein